MFLTSMNPSRVAFAGNASKTSCLARWSALRTTCPSKRLHAILLSTGSLVRPWSLRTRVSSKACSHRPTCSTRPPARLACRSTPKDSPRRRHDVRSLAIDTQGPSAQSQNPASSSAAAHALRSTSRCVDASNTVRLRKASADSVAYAMSTPVVSVSPQTSMQEAAALLLRHHVSRLPVTGNDGKLLGILTTTDVMNAVVTDPDGCEIYF